MHVFLPLERELCPFDLAPVTSTAIQMLFGDTCSVVIMQAKALTMDEYAMNHPAGRIGKRLILNVRDVMKPLKGLPLCAADDVLIDVLVELSSKGSGWGPGRGARRHSLPNVECGTDAPVMLD